MFDYRRSNIVCWLFTVLLLSAAVFLLFSCDVDKIYVHKIDKPPVSTMQLGPSLFLNEKNIWRLALSEGKLAQVSYKKRSVTLRVFKYWGSDSSCAIHKQWLDSLGLKYGNYELEIVPLKNSTVLSSISLEKKIESLEGDNQSWPKMVLGTPHADCDWYTGEIGRIVNKRYKIPVISAWKYRLSYRGIWYDVNRPLMKLPKKDGRGVINNRVVNDQSRAVYSEYLKKTQKTANVNDKQLLDFYFDLHGHDLSVKKDGKKIYRNVVEGIASGFTMEELRRIKKIYNNYSLNKIGKDYPPLYFGNLPEDQEYVFAGVKVPIFYTGLGTRTYGILQSDVVKRILHMETPNSLRLTKGIRPITAGLINEIFSFVKDSLPNERFSNTIYSFPQKKLEKNIFAHVSAGSFLMGSPEGKGWADTKPLHTVYLDDFSISTLEVTNGQFAEFLNEALKKGLIVEKNGVVNDASEMTHVICRLQRDKPLSQITYKDEQFSSPEERKNFPVIYVSWYGAKKYADYFGLRLPSEAEWNKAASWNGKKSYQFAYQTDDFDLKKGNCENSGDIYEKGLYPWTTPVGHYKYASFYGCYDMSGNVWEWCDDNYEYSYYKQEPESGWKNPRGGKSSNRKTIRGGAWNTEYKVTSTYFRMALDPNSTHINVGFRCAK